MQHSKGLSIGSPFVLLKKKTPVRMSEGGMWGSNPRHSEPQSDALPTELRPPYALSRMNIHTESGCKDTIIIRYLQIFRLKNYKASQIRHLFATSNAQSVINNQSSVHDG